MPNRARLAFSTAVLGLCVFLSACADEAERIQLVIGGARFSIEVARTDAQRATGLMYRKTMGPNEGMLFVFDADSHLQFWMKNTSIPLSIAFLSAEGKILEIADMQPFSESIVRSRFSARYALELNQGRFREVGVSAGDMVIFPPDFK